MSARPLAAAFALALLGASSHAFAADPPPPESEWDRRFTAAGRALVSGDSTAAASEYSELAASAPTENARLAALEQLRLASEAARKAGRLPAPYDATPEAKFALPPAPEPRDPHRRTTDELFVLMGTVPAYALVTGFWLDSLVLKRSPSVGVPVLTLGIAGASGLALAMVENGGALRYGVPQSISTGVIVGAAGGVAVGAYSSITNRSSKTGVQYREFLTWSWSLATVGGITGGFLGSTLETTPGRSAWVGTTGLVTGLIAGGIAGAVAKRSANGDITYFSLTAALGGAVGLGAGFATAGLLSPSMSRVRYIDLASFSGGAIALGTCVATGKCSSNGAFAALSIGTAVGFLAGFFGTWVLPAEKLPSKGGTKTTATGVGAVLEHASPYVNPSEGGVTFGVSGTL